MMIQQQQSPQQQQYFQQQHFRGGGGRGRGRGGLKSVEAEVVVPLSLIDIVGLTDCTPILQRNTETEQKGATSRQP